MVFSKLGEILDSTSSTALIMSCCALLITSVLVGRFIPRNELLAAVIVLCGIASFLIMRLPLREQVPGLVVLGFASYWAAGVSLGLRPGMPAEIPLSFLPYLILGLVDAVVVLISYTRSFNHGAAFAAPSIALILCNGPAAFGERLDLFIISLAATVAASLAFPYFVSKANGLVQSIIASLEASAVSSAIMGIVVTISLKTLFINAGSFSTFFNVFWYALVSFAFMTTIGIGAHELFAWSSGVKLERVDGKASYVLTGESEEEEGEEGEKVGLIQHGAFSDPYDGLISEMKEFLKAGASLSIIQRTEKKARFKKEFQVLASRHKTSKKNVAKKLLDEVLKK